MADFKATDDQLLTVYQMSVSGKSTREICAQTGLKERTVQRIRAELNTPGKVNRPFTDEELATAQTMLDDGCSYAEVARTLGRRDHGIRQRFPGRGWSQEQIREWSSWAMKMRHERKKLRMTAIAPSRHRNIHARTT